MIQADSRSVSQKIEPAADLPVRRTAQSLVGTRTGVQQSQGIVTANQRPQPSSSTHQPLAASVSSKHSTTVVNNTTLTSLPSRNIAAASGYTVGALQSEYDAFRPRTDRRAVQEMKEVHKVTLPTSWVKVGKAAEHLGVSTGTVRQWAMEGLIKSFSVGVGKHRLIDLNDAESFMRDHTTLRK